MIEHKGPLCEGAPAKRVGERQCRNQLLKFRLSPSVAYGDSSLTEGAFSGRAMLAPTIIDTPNLHRGTKP